MNSSLAELERELRATPPAALGQLAPEQVSDLTQAIRSAHKRQTRELAAAGDAAMGMIPRLLRGPIKRLLG